MNNKSFCGKNGNCQGFRGSAAVEAALIMPLVLCVVILLLEYILMLHDNAVITGIVEEEAGKLADYLDGKSGQTYDFEQLSKSRMFFGDKAAAVEKTKTETEERAAKSLIFSSPAVIDVQTGITGITVTVKLRFRRTAPFLRSTERTVSTQRTLFDRESKTRLAAVIADAAKKAAESITGSGGNKEDAGNK